MEMIPELDQCLELLLSWLDQGWQIEQPVLQRSGLPAATSRLFVFEVIVIREGEWRVIALNDGPDVSAFFDHYRVEIAYL